MADVEVHIRIIDIIPEGGTIGTGTCLGIEDGGIRPIGRVIGVAHGIILLPIWEAV